MTSRHHLTHIRAPPPTLAGYGSPKTGPARIRGVRAIISRTSGGHCANFSGGTPITRNVRSG